MNKHTEHENLIFFQEVLSKLKNAKKIIIESSNISAEQFLSLGFDASPGAYMNSLAEMKKHTEILTYIDHRIDRAIELIEIYKKQ